MAEPIDILVIEDDEVDYQLLVRYLRSNNIACNCHWVDDAASLRNALLTQTWDLVISDYRLPAMHTLHILSYVITELPDVPIILLSGTIGEERAVELFKEGVDDCVNNGKLVRLVSALERSLREAHSHMVRQQAEAELLPSEKRYRNLIEQLPDIIYTASLDAVPSFQFVSPQIERVLGYNSEQIVGDRGFFAKQIHSQDQERVLAEFRQRSCNNKASCSEYRIWAADGHLVWLRDEARTVQPDPGKPRLLLGVLRDITEQKRTTKQLARAEDEWTQAMEQFAHAILLLDMDRRLVRANSAFYRMLGIDVASSVGQYLADLVYPEGEQSPCRICQALETRQEGVFTIEPEDAGNPTGRPLELTLKLVHDSSGIATGMVMGLNDLTRIRQTEQRLRQSAIVFENTADGVIITDADNNIIDVNRAFTEITGYRREEVLGKNPRILRSQRHDEKFYQALWNSLNTTGKWRGEIWNRRKDGSIYPEWLTISNVHEEGGKLTNYVAVFADISAVKHSQEQMEYLAHHDALTGLPNRLLFNDRLSHALNHAQRNRLMLAVTFLDLDRFKNINDSLGHQAGDALLKQVAKVLVRSVRQEDTVARIGGDEFILILENIHEAKDAMIAAEKLMLALNEPFKLEGQEIHVAASMGISLYPRDGKDASTLLRNADAAMYRAKEGGRNGYQFYTRELTQNAIERVFMENNLRRALEQDELTLFYQPQIDLHTGRIIGIEALVRWQHPELGIVSPAKFIPVAEDCGLIHSVGDWVLQTACTQAACWLKKGLSFGHIAVNVAGRQLQRGGIVNTVRTALKESGLPLSMLELEVTENFIMREAEHAINQLEALRELGVVLAIDDFGTGYSSLSYLKRLPINKLKIDQSFVRDIPEDPNDIAISNAVIALGQSLQMTVIAEGVETSEQVEFLKEAGCHEAQGYFYSMPLSSDRMEVFLAQWDSEEESAAVN